MNLAERVFKFFTPCTSVRRDYPDIQGYQHREKVALSCSEKAVISFGEA
jgi:hypothetical protein